MAMIRVRYGRVSAALALASVVSILGLGGCADDYAGILILQNLATTTGACSPEPSTSSPFLSHGIAQVGSGGGYVLTPLLQSTLVNREGTTNGDIVLLHTAVVEIEPVDSAESRAVVSALKELQGRTRYISGSVAPRGLTTMSFEGIDSEQAVALAAAMMPGEAVEVLLRVVVHGDTQGTNVSSQPFLYPVTLVNEAGGGFVNLGACSSLDVGTVGGSEGCFGTGQDGGFIECCTDAGGRPVCPARGTGTAGP
jgi:hypothetical protein